MFQFQLAPCKIFKILTSMRILQLTYSLSSGGGERFVVDLSNELCKEHNVTLVQILSNDNTANAHYLPDVDKRIKYINLNHSKGLSWGVMRDIYALIQKVNPDVVHVHCSLLVVALAVMLYKKPKYCHTIHSLAQRCITPKQLIFVYKYLYKHRVLPITISPTCLKSYKDLLHLTNGVMITNGRSPIELTNEVYHIKAEIELLKKHIDDKVFLHVARMHPVKNQALLFEAFDSLIKEGEHILLVVIGDGYDGSPYERYCLNEGIHIMGAKRNVGDYLAAADYFVMSSKMEGLPISLLEAMSMGLIPVSTPAGGVCDVVKNGKNGYISNSHSFEDFCRSVKNAIDNIYGITSESIIAEYKEKYSMTACAKYYLEQYKK